MRQRLFRLVILLIFLIIPLFTFAQESWKYDSFKFQINFYNYAYHLPNNYSSFESYPVLISPGEGTRGSDKSFYWNVDNPGKYGWILVEFPLWKHNSSVVAVFLEELKERFNVEGEKFHIVGYNEKSASCFGHVIANPDYFHSITGIPGNPFSKNKDQLASLKGIKIQNIVSEKDNFWLEEAKSYDSIYRELEIFSILDIIPGSDHSLEYLTGTKFMEKMERMRN